MTSFPASSVQLIPYHNPLTKMWGCKNSLPTSVPGFRNAGEIWGHLVEEIVRHLLRKEFPLQCERLLIWKEKDPSGNTQTRWRELDAVVALEHLLMIFEVKLTSVRKMRKGAGRQQLHTASRILAATGHYPQVLKRLVYIGSPSMLASSVWPALSTGDTYQEAGILWIPPATIDATAISLGINLSRHWRNPRYRQAAMSWEQVVRTFQDCPAFTQ